MGVWSQSMRPEFAMIHEDLVDDCGCCHGVNPACNSTSTYRVDGKQKLRAVAVRRLEKRAAPKLHAWTTSTSTKPQLSYLLSYQVHVSPPDSTKVTPVPTVVSGEHLKYIPPEEQKANDENN